MREQKPARIPFISPSSFHRDQEALAKHNARMEAGCLVCRSALPGRVCPDCYVCVACGPGCDECDRA